MKIKSIIKVEKRKLGEWVVGTYTLKKRTAIDRAKVEGFNEGQDLIGNKEIGLDMGKMEKVIYPNLVLMFNAKNSEDFNCVEINKIINKATSDLAQFLKAQEKSIIVEVEDEKSN